MLLQHIGFQELGRKLDKALDICGQYERKLVVTGRSTGCTGREFADYVLDTVKNPRLEQCWEEYAYAQ
jgi:hypothetical protein